MSWRSAVILLEVCAVLAVIVGLVVGAAAWRLAQGPLDVTFAKETITSNFEAGFDDRQVDVDSLILQWPDFEGPLLLGVSGLRMSDRADNPTFMIDQIGVSLSKAHIFIGQLRPVGLVLKRPILRLSRDAAGAFDFDFSIEGTETRSDINPLESLVDAVLDHNDQSALSSLRAFQIENAQLYLQDYKNNQQWSLPNMNFLMERVRSGINATAFISLEEYGPAQTRQKEAPGFIQAEALISEKDDDVEISAQFKALDSRILDNLDPALSVIAEQNMRIDGLIAAHTGMDMSLKDLQLSISSDEGAFKIPDAYDAPVPYQDLKLSSFYNAEQGALEVKTLAINLKGVPVEGEASLKITPEKITGPIKISIDELAHEKIAPLWPKFLIGDSSEEWVVQKLSKGTFTNSFMRADLIVEKAEDEWGGDVQNLEAGFEFENLAVDYRQPMLPVTEAKGKGFLDQNEDTLSIDIESAKIADLAIKSGVLKFFDVIAEGKGTAEITTELTGPITTAINYISKEPIALKHDFDLTKIKGTADLSVEVAFPTNDIQVEDVGVKVTGTARDALMPGLVRGLDVSGGPFSILVESNDVIIEGRGQLAGRPMRAKYEAFLESDGQPFKSRATASLNADANLRQHFGIDLNDFIEGTAPVDVVYTEFSDARAQADVNVNLKPLKAFVKPFKYEKPVGKDGSASLKISVLNGNPVEVTHFNASAPGLKLDNATLKFRQIGAEAELASGSLPSFSIGQTRGSMNFEVQPSGRMKFVVNTPSFDARPFLENGDKDQSAGGPPVLVSLSAARMITVDGEAVNSAKIYVDLDGKGRFNQFEVDAQVGTGKAFLRFKPDQTGARSFKFQAEDAGAALKAFGIYDKMVGGTLSIYGEPVRGAGDRDMLGLAEVSDFKVVNAPVLGQLLSALSLPGLISLLGEEGVSFSKLESKFNWAYRPEGSLLTMEEGRTSGNSLGLTFDGTFDMAAGNLDIAGTVVPISGLNKAISSIPLIGTILSGGSDSVFAATYTMKGEAKNPEIFVNPLAALTPGLIRRILFE